MSSYPTHSQRIAARIIKAARRWVTATEVMKAVKVSHKTANAYLQLWARDEGILESRLRDVEDRPKGYTPSEYRLKSPSKWGGL
jgi:response regulator of citrate/malate metabolism